MAEEKAQDLPGLAVAEEHPDEVEGTSHPRPSMLYPYPDLAVSLSRSPDLVVSHLRGLPEHHLSPPPKIMRTLGSFY